MTTYFEIPIEYLRKESPWGWWFELEEGQQSFLSKKTATRFNEDNVTHILLTVPYWLIIADLEVFKRIETVQAYGVIG